eukprot:Anaeramoba_flamelloidesa1054062_16.p1 GENE.a1054062_16~~a1054062_16.p1  ORF type:complete len:113 (+),score=26.13 a1054062_16:32-340(+)
MSGSGFGFSIEEGNREDHNFYGDTSSDTSSDDDDFEMFDEYGIDDDDDNEKYLSRKYNLYSKIYFDDPHSLVVRFQIDEHYYLMINFPNSAKRVGFFVRPFS